MIINMNEYINQNTLCYYAQTNEKFIKSNPKGIILEFPGLGGGSCLGGVDNVEDYSSDFAKKCAENGIILAYVFTGPWSWMNEGGVRIADAVVDALCEKYSFNNPTIVARGGSMGGLGALIYSLHSSHKITACSAACPCIDVIEAIYAHPNFPRTFISAVAGYKDSSLTESLMTLSPMHNIDKMPHIPYFIACCCDDELFSEEELDRYVEKMRASGYDIECVKMIGKKHGYFSSEGLERMREFELSFFE
ncbi:MAG: alpha/beta hydrolase [Ruminococcaceae bacterium]|nr:alpha/beta hydrolase [Oscillospiraceae bacterium]